MKKFYFFVFFSLLLIGCVKQTYYKRSQFLMGTNVEITTQDYQAIDAAFGEIRRIEGLLSKFDKHGEIYRLNQQGILKVSPDTLYVVKKAKEFYHLSRGAFDITVAPVVDLWKEAIKTKMMPDPEKIKQALKYVGSDKIIIDEENSVIQFSQEGVSIDLGAIAKGFAVDCAINKLKELDVKSALINAGGDIYCLGSKEGNPWRIGIQHPRIPNQMLDYLELKDRAVATSGDYEQYFISHNKRYSHIIDPKTGFPVDNDVESVSIIADDCLTADTLATGIFVLGKQKGQELITKFKDAEAIIYTKESLHE